VILPIAPACRHRTDNLSHPDLGALFAPARPASRGGAPTPERVDAGRAGATLGRSGWGRGPPELPRTAQLPRVFRRTCEIRPPLFEGSPWRGDPPRTDSGIAHQGGGCGRSRTWVPRQGLPGPRDRGVSPLRFSASSMLHPAASLRSPWSEAPTGRRGRPPLPAGPVRPRSRGPRGRSTQLQIIFTATTWSPTGEEGGAATTSPAPRPTNDRNARTKTSDPAIGPATIFDAARTEAGASRVTTATSCPTLKSPWPETFDLAIGTPAPRAKADSGKDAGRVHSSAMDATEDTARGRLAAVDGGPNRQIGRRGPCKEETK
jgi:hypothetical protein